MTAIDAEALGSPLVSETVGGCRRTPEVSPPHSSPALRAIVRDEPGRAIELQIYDQRGLVATVPVSAQRALALAEQLVAAARRRMPE
jgi:hypothetical protein